MRKLPIAAAAAATLTLAQPALAQIGVEANGARADDRWGGELGVGYSFGAAGFSLTPIVGVLLHEGDNDRYYQDDLGNGQTRCRDSTNGQFAEDEKCDNLAAKVYGKIEATYAIPLGPELGGGVRFSKGSTTPYGTAAVSLAPLIKLKGSIGDDYYALGLRARF